MADQAERVILEAEDQVSPVVDKANAGLDRFEKQAESSHGKVIRISDQSLGEYGTRVKDAELRTGLTAKEVGQFGFAARAVGQDISIVERLMRGMCS